MQRLGLKALLIDANFHGLLAPMLCKRTRNYIMKRWMASGWQGALRF